MTQATASPAHRSPLCSNDVPAPQRVATVDLAAIAANVESLRAAAPTSKLMAVLKADGYGHGLIPAAHAALAGGADYLGTAVLEEAFAVRAAGIRAPLFSWLAAPGADYARAITEGIDVAAYGPEQLEEIAGAALESGGPARIHLKIDTGMWRGGATAQQWLQLVSRARSLEAEGAVRIVGIWSHLACADEPGHPSIGEQLEVFRLAIATARESGLKPAMCHIANSAATLSCSAAHFDMVRPGIAVYGVNPLPPEARPGTAVLRPAMTLSARIVQVKHAPEGVGVSYGHTERTIKPTTLAVVPLGYADGVPRTASSRGPVQIGDRRFKVMGRVCMDQFVIDVGDSPVSAGAEAILFGPGDRGEPHADEWAEAAGTIAYEILTRVGSRVPRHYVGWPSGT